MGERSVVALTAAEFAALLDKLLSIRWPVPTGRMHSLADAWRWPTTSEPDDEGGFEADPGYHLASKSLADFYAFDGELTSIVVATSDYVPHPTDAPSKAIDDAFTSHVAVARQRLGASTPWQDGDLASETWDLPSGATLQIVRSASSAWVTTASPTEVAIRRALRD